METERFIRGLKGALRSLRQILETEGPLKEMKKKFTLS